MGRRLVVPEEFWIQLRAGVPVTTAARAVGFSADTAWRRLAEIGGPAALGVEHHGTGRPWGGRKSETVRDVFWDSLRRGDTVAAATRAAGVSKATGRNWLIKAGGVRPRANNPDLEAEGEAQNAKGHTQESWGKVKRGVGDAIEDVGDAIRDA